MQAAELLKSQISEGLIKGACAIKGSTSGVEEIICCGEADYLRGTPMSVDSVFDIASISKVFGVTTLLLHCRAKNLLDFDEQLGKYLPELSDKATSRITLRQLATHYSGLDNSKPYNKYIGDAAALYKAIFQVEPVTAAGTRFEYSCVNFILLGFVVERLLRQSLKRAAREFVFKPLGMKHSFWGSVPDALHENLVRMYNAEPGVISDESARGLFPAHMAGNAGIFTSGADAALYCRALLMAGRHEANPALVEHETFLAAADEIFTCCSPDGMMKRSVGWGYGDQAGFSPEVIYHSGWSGQTVWIDRKLNKFVIVFSNRVGDWAQAKQARLDFAGAWVNEK